MVLDGMEIGDRTHVVALGISTEGGEDPAQAHPRSSAFGPKVHQDPAILDEHGIRLQTVPAMKSPAPARELELPVVPRAYHNNNVRLNQRLADRRKGDTSYYSAAPDRTPLVRANVSKREEALPRAVHANLRVADLNDADGTVLKLRGCPKVNGHPAFPSGRGRCQSSLPRALALLLSLLDSAYSFHPARQRRPPALVAHLPRSACTSSA